MYSNRVVHPFPFFSLSDAFSFPHLSFCSYGGWIWVKDQTAITIVLRSYSCWAADVTSRESSLYIFFFKDVHKPTSDLWRGWKYSCAHELPTTTACVVFIINARVTQQRIPAISLMISKRAHHQYRNVCLMHNHVLFSFLFYLCVCVVFTRAYIQPFHFSISLFLYSCFSCFTVSPLQFQRNTCKHSGKLCVVNANTRMHKQNV